MALEPLFVVLFTTLIYAGQRVLDLAGEHSEAFVMVTDMDTASLDPASGKWVSFLQHGSVTLKSSGRYCVNFNQRLRLESDVSHKGRGMELSALAWWKGGLRAFCDRSGADFLLDHQNGNISLVQTLLAGDGSASNKPFKSEWAVVKDGDLMVGSFAKEWVENNQIVHHDFEWVKRIHANGSVSHVDFRAKFDVIRQHLHATFPSYWIVEAVEWVPVTKQWIILPRKLTQGAPYDESLDELRSSNVMVLVDETFSRVDSVETVGPMEPEWGFTEIALLPNKLQRGRGSAPVFIGLKAREVQGQTLMSKVTIFDSNGHTLLDPACLSSNLNSNSSHDVGDSRDFLYVAGQVKFEGLAFVPSSKL